MFEPSIAALEAAVPPGWQLHAQDTRDGDGGLPPDHPIKRIFDEREGVRDEAVAKLERELRKTADKLATSLTEYIEGRAGSTETARIRAAIFQTELDDLLGLLEREGLADAREEWFRSYAKLAGLAEEQLAAAGVDGAERALDSEAAQAALRALRDQHDDEWIDEIERPAAHRILTGLRTSIELQTLDEVARTIADDEGESLPRAVTHARTRMAEFDRWAGAEAAREIDPEGDFLVWGYIGPDDGIERPFCDTINRHYFSRKLLGKLNNAQPGTGHPATGGGGWNCRHSWVQGDAEYLASLGYRKGTQAIVELANLRARASRKKSKGGRK